MDHRGILELLQGARAVAGRISEASDLRCDRIEREAEVVMNVELGECAAERGDLVEGHGVGK